MKRLRTSPYSLLAIALVGAAFATSTFAQSTRKNPTSKLYITEVKGDASINTGDRITAVSQKDVYAAEGSVIETKENSSNAMVLSNGTALFVGPQSRIQVQKFLQEPFSPDRTDLDVEPSISQTVVRVIRGSLGVCTSRLIAGSSMVYTTPHATLNIRGRKFLVEVMENETRVSLLEGDITVIGDARGGGESLKPGQQALIYRSSPDAPVKIMTRAIPAEDNARIDENASVACLSRRTVFFDVANRASEAGDSEINPVEITPTAPPTQFTVSPTRINNG